MNAAARVAHALPSRTRVKIPSERGKSDYFAQLVERLTKCPGVLRAQANARTGSVVIEHRAPFPRIAAFAQDNGLFVVDSYDVGVSRATVSQHFSQQLNWLDEQITDLSDGHLDLRSLLAMSLLTMAFLQIFRGQVLGPASGLFWQALRLFGAEPLLYGDDV